MPPSWRMSIRTYALTEGAAALTTAALARLLAMPAGAAAAMLSCCTILVHVLEMCGKNATQ